MEASHSRADCRGRHAKSTDRYATNELQPKKFAYAPRLIRTVPPQDPIQLMACCNFVILRQRMVSAVTLSLCFIDTISWDYNVDTPTQRPLGGSQSALCYLAVELAKLGHAVTLLSNTSKSGVVAGVTCQSLQIQFLVESRFDAVIVLNGPAELSTLRWNLPSSTTLLLWTQLATDEKAMKGLATRNKAKKWDHIICISDWQRRTFIEQFRIEPERVSVLRNAIAPAFENLFPSRDALLQAKVDGLRLAYTSTPYRGLDVLLEIFPSIRSEHAQATLDIYSSLAVYQYAASADPYAALYRTSEAMPGVNYLGSVPQPALARALSRAHVLSYSNTFPETSCIAVMEALAAGLLVVTSELGALPETSLGFANLVPYHSRDRANYGEAYKRMLSKTLKSYSPVELGERLYKQVVTMNSACTWRIRAREWTEFLTEVCSTRKGPISFRSASLQT